MIKSPDRWVLCPICGNKTRTKIRPDTILENFPLFCPKCKQETLISAKDLNVAVIPQQIAESAGAVNGQDERANVETVRNSEIMRRQWDNYRKDFDYASTISFDEVCDAVASTMDTLITNNFFN